MADIKNYTLNFGPQHPAAHGVVRRCRWQSVCGPNGSTTFSGRIICLALTDRCVWQFRVVALTQ
jgi:hypothetical protein